MMNIHSAKPRRKSLGYIQYQWSPNIKVGKNIRGYADRAKNPVSEILTGSPDIYISTYYQVEPPALPDDFLHAELVCSRDAVAQHEDEDKLDIVAVIKEKREKPEVSVREVRSQGNLNESNEDARNYNNNYNYFFLLFVSLYETNPVQV